MNATRTRGFTLLEMAVVLALVAMMSILIIEGLRFGARAYSRVLELDEAANAFAAQRFLRDTLESAQPFSPDRAHGAAFGLEGTATQLSFTASRSPFKGPGALERYEVFLSSNGTDLSRQDLKVSWRVDRDGQGATADDGGNEEVLLENVAQLELAYLDAGCDAPGTWRDAWQGHHELPALVRARIIFPPGDARRWPDLLVRPRATDDAFLSLYRSGDEHPVCGKAG